MYLYTIGKTLLDNRTICWILNKIDSLGRLANHLLIDFIIHQVRTRPHPFSTAHSFVSWKGLTDKTWNARHLPENNICHLPSDSKLLTMFERPDGHQRLCPKSTCLFPAFAQYLTDGFIRTNTDRSDPNHLKRTTSNHNIDLCTLYGINEVHTRALRVQDPAHDQRGMLKSQQIDDEEFAPFLFSNGEIDSQFKDLDLPLGIEDLHQAVEDIDSAVGREATEKLNYLFACGGDRVNSVPQVSMINSLLLREHNRLARNLGEQNPDWSDDRVFETSRNVLIVEFIRVVVEEYINHISPIMFKFRTDPAIAWKAKWNRPNWVTTEFSLLYRWHALIPDRINWGECEFEISDTFLDNRPLVALGLGRSFEAMSEQAATELGPLNTTTSLLPVEKASIIQGRTCRLAPFSDYLEYLGRKPLNSFEDISSRRQVRELLRKFYRSPREIEYFIGLFAEDRVPNSPLPSTILQFVAIDAFSQALTNPLLSEHVFNEDTFTSYGMQQIEETTSLVDILRRNVADPDGIGFVSMTRSDWTRL